MSPITGSQTVQAQTCTDTMGHATNSKFCVRNTALRVVCVIMLALLQRLLDTNTIQMSGLCLLTLQKLAWQLFLHIKVKVKVEQSLDRPRHALMVPGGCQTYALAASTLQEIFLVLISVRGRVYPRATVRSFFYIKGINSYMYP